MSRRPKSFEPHHHLYREQQRKKAKDKAELKPCPFCGADASSWYEAGSWGYSRDTFGVRCSKGCVKLTGSKEKWNTRV